LGAFVSFVGTAENTYNWGPKLETLLTGPNLTPHFNKPRLAVLASVAERACQALIICLLILPFLFSVSLYFR
jgi:hypothetical protein